LTGDIKNGVFYTTKGVFLGCKGGDNINMENVNPFRELWNSIVEGFDRDMFDFVINYLENMGCWQHPHKNERKSLSSLISIYNLTLKWN